MTRVFAILILLCLLRSGHAQMATYDVRSDINQTNQYLLSLKGFGEATQQTKVLKDTYEFYKKAQETLSKVNRVVNDFYAVQNIIRSQVEAVRLYGSYTSQARGFKHVSQARITSFTSVLNGLSTSVNQLLKQAQLILRDDYFKMTDAERLKFLSDIDTQMSEKKTLMKIKFHELKAEEDERAILKAL